MSKWPTDVLRHSFGTYRMHTIQTVALLADEMGNSPTIIEKYYFQKGIDPTDVTDFWNLTPLLLDEEHKVDTRSYMQPREWHYAITHKLS